MSCCHQYITGTYRFIFRVGIPFHKAFVWTRLNPPWKTPTHLWLNPTILHLDLTGWCGCLMWPVTTRMTLGTPFFYTVTLKDPTNPGVIPTYSTHHLAPQKGVMKIHSMPLSQREKNKSPSNECSKHFGSGIPQKNLNFFSLKQFPSFPDTHRASKPSDARSMNWCSLQKRNFAI